MFNKDVKVPLQEAELVGTSSSTFILSCLLASRRNVEDFVDAKYRYNLVNWESIAGSPLQIIPNWNNLRNII